MHDTKDEPDIESLLNNDPELAQAVIKAMTSELFGDVKSLRSEVHRLAQKVETLSPAIEEVEDKWLKAKTHAISAAFKNDIREILKDEASESFSRATTSISRSNDLLNIAVEEINRYGWFLLSSCIAAGALSAGVIFTLLLYFKFFMM